MSFLSIEKARCRQIIINLRNINTMELRRGRNETLGSCNKNCKSFWSTSVPATVLHSLFDLILRGVLAINIVRVQKQKVRTMEWLPKFPQWSWSSDVNPACQTHMASASSPSTRPKIDWLNYKAIKKVPVFQFMNIDDEGKLNVGDIRQISWLGVWFYL